MCLGTFSACGGLRKRHLPFRRSAILAERFCVIGDEVSYDTKKSRSHCYEIFRVDTGIRTLGLQSHNLAR